MMLRIARRLRRPLTLALVLMHLCGTRVHAHADACEKTRTYFGPALAFKAVVKAATGARWGSSPLQQRSFGEKACKHCACELDGIRGSRLAPAAVPAAPPTICAAPRGARPIDQPLLAELRATPHLHSKK